MTEKLLLINQLLTDVSGMDTTNQEKEVELILNKIFKIKKIEEQEIEKDALVAGLIIANLEELKKVIKFEIRKMLTQEMIDKRIDGLIDILKERLLSKIRKRSE